jgi:hypothetical protein
MSLTPIRKQIEANIPESIAKLPAKLPKNISNIPKNIPWTSAFAAGTLVASAILLIRGKRRPALAVAAAGTVVALVENADAARELWDNLPRYVRSGRDLLEKAEGFVEDLGRQSGKVRDLLGRR